MKILSNFLVLSLGVLLVSSVAIAQPVADGDGDVVIGGVTPDISAVLDLQSTSKGLLMPRMLETERDAIVDPATGLIVFNTDSSAFQVNTGTPAAPIWETILTDSTIGDVAWKLGGNTAPTSNIFGTLDATEIDIRTNNVTAMKIGADGHIGIGTDPAPSPRVEIVGDGGGAAVRIRSGRLNLAGNNAPLRLNGSEGTANQLLQSNGSGTTPGWTSDLNVTTVTTTGDVNVGGDLNVTGDIVGGFTLGSVLFAGATGDITEDNTNFFFDDTDDELGLGTTAPTAKLDITQTAGVTAPSLAVNQTGGTGAVDVNLTSVSGPGVDISGTSIFGNLVNIDMSASIGNALVVTNSTAGDAAQFNATAGGRAVVANAPSTNGIAFLATSGATVLSYAAVANGGTIPANVSVVSVTGDGANATAAAVTLPATGTNGQIIVITTDDPDGVSVTGGSAPFATTNQHTAIRYIRAGGAWIAEN